MWARFASRRVMAVGLAAILLASSVAVYMQRRAEAPLKLLIAATATHRHIEPRLTGGFAHAPLTINRGGETRQPGTDLHLATLEAARVAEETPTPGHLAVLGKALLLSGDADGAVEALERASSLAPADAAIWSDLSAGYFVRAQAGSPADSVRALDAALKATAGDPALPEARFNATLALSLNNLPIDAALASGEYRTLDPGSAWSAEFSRFQEPADARTWDALRGRLLSSPSDATAEAEAVDRFPHAVREVIAEDLLPAWALPEPSARARGCAAFEQARRLARLLYDSGGDSFSRDLVRGLSPSACPSPAPTLKRGIQSFRDASRLMRQADYGAALAGFQAAVEELTRASSPLQQWARVQMAHMQFQAGDLAGTIAQSRAVEIQARQSGHHALLARALFVAALAIRDQGRPDRALQMCTESIEYSDRVREAFHSRATARAAADIARTAGDDRESWRLMVRSLAAIDQDPSRIRRYQSYFNAALFARSSGLLDASLAFQNAAVRAAGEITETGALAQALGHRAYLFFLLGRRTSDGELTRARRELETFTASPRAFYEAELDTIEAAIRLASRPADAVRLLETASRVFERIAPEQIPDTHVAMARAWARLGNAGAAIRTLKAGIEFFENRRLSIVDEDARIAFFGTARDLYRDLISLLVDRGEAEAAFAYSDRIRARALTELTAATQGLSATPAALTRAMGSRTAFVAYLVTDRQLTIWVVADGTLSMHRTSIAAGQLDSSVAALRSPRTAEDERAASSALYAHLIAPIAHRLTSAQTLYVSPDGPLFGLAFAQLLNGARNRRLIEDLVTVTVPGASWLAALERGGSRRREAGLEILAVGNPAIPPGEQSLPPLPAAEQEAVRVAAMYASANVLRGASATRSSVLARAPRARIIHFAGHAVHNAASPTLSYLLLAPEAADDDGRLRPPEIAALALQDTELVILGACSTARGVVRFGEGPMTLARPFLAAGARTVIASLWDVDDRATHGLLTRMHQALRGGLSPAEALRQAQLTMLRAADPRDRDPRFWAAFAVVGSNFTTGDRDE